MLNLQYRPGTYVILGTKHNMAITLGHILCAHKGMICCWICKPVNATSATHTHPDLFPVLPYCIAKNLVWGIPPPPGHPVMGQNSKHHYLLLVIGYV